MAPTSCLCSRELFLTFMLGKVIQTICDSDAHMLLEAAVSMASHLLSLDLGSPMSPFIVHGENLSLPGACVGSKCLQCGSYGEGLARRVMVVNHKRQTEFQQ